MAELKNIAILGAGITGRLLATGLGARGHRVRVFEQAPEGDRQGCSFTAAGMLTPFSELETAEPIIAEIGLHSLSIWADLVGELPSVPFEKKGSLIVAPASHPEELDHFLARLQSHPASQKEFRLLDRDELVGSEGELGARFDRALALYPEAVIHTGAVMDALKDRADRLGIDFFFNSHVTNVGPGCFTVGDNELFADLVVDCRGLGARPDLPDLRGVRGEIAFVHAPGVQLSRPVRFLHPRYPVYIVPRGPGEFAIGATSLESEDQGPVSVRSAVELLTAAWTVHPGFAEARITELRTGLRPALPDHLPLCQAGKGLIRLNGMYRHGYLLGPALTAAVMDLVDGGDPPEYLQPVFRHTL